MTQRETKHRPAGAAIAAALLLSTSPLAAQEVEPAPASEPTVTSEPGSTTSEPVAEPTTTAATEPANEATASDAAAAPAASATRTRTAPRQAASARTSAPRTAPAAATVAPAPAIAEPMPAVASTTTEPMAPVAGQAAPVADPAEPAVGDDLMIAGAAGAGLLALAGLGFAAYRRRRHDEEDYLFNEEAALVHEPAPTPVAPVVRTPGPVADRSMPMPGHVRTPMQSASAFAWGNAVTPRAEPTRRRESMTEAAMRGPTPDNPSLSLKKRLKRAAFFEQRERLVRAGKADRIETQAGLPDAATEPTRPLAWNSSAGTRALQLA